MSASRLLLRARVANRRSTDPGKGPPRWHAAAEAVSPIAVAFVLWALFGPAFANYDSLYGLVWGQEVASGQVPDYRAPVAPTPKPLLTLVGAALSPFGHDAEAILVAGSFLALGVLGVLVYRLGALWFSPAVGLLAAAIVLTREPIISFGVRAYVDIAYIVLVLAALLAESHRSRSGATVLTLLALAGLLRPEAWLFSAAYLVYLLPGLSWGRAGVLALLAASAPLGWAVSDLIATGDPLFSLVNTRATGAQLDRDTGPGALVAVTPWRLGEILREPALVGAAGGGLASLVLLPRRARLPAIAGVAAIASFAVFAVSGLPLLGRYLLLPAVLLSIFCGVGVFGWRMVERKGPRRIWAIFGLAVALLLIGFIPAQAGRLVRLDETLGAQREVRDDLHRLADAGVFRPSCGSVATPNHRPVPLLALWLDRRPSGIVSAQLTRLANGYFIDPADARVEGIFTLDPNDPKKLVAGVPPGFSPIAQNRSWKVYERCVG